MVIADYYSKWTESFANQIMESTTIARFIAEEVIRRNGTPRSTGRKQVVLIYVLKVRHQKEIHKAPYRP